MLSTGNNPGLINLSFVLYERGANANYPRIHADSLNQPFDINSGAKLQLGSTAKLRTPITYLDIMVALTSKWPPARARIAAYRGNGAGQPDPLGGGILATTNNGLCSRCSLPPCCAPIRHTRPLISPAGKLLRQF